jgi:hypothetical protein
MVEQVATKIPSDNHHEIALDVEVAKIVSENLATSEGLDVAETIASVTHDNARQEEDRAVV